MGAKRIQARPALYVAEAEPAAHAGEKKKRAKLPVDWRDHVNALEAQVRGHDPIPADALGEADDLPAELLRELSVGRADPLGAQIIVVFEGCGGLADLDQVLIGLYRAFRVIHRRRVIQNKIWQMIRKGHLRKVKGARGLFCLPSRKATVDGGRNKRARKH
jgi:hypothetical protein